MNRWKTFNLKTGNFPRKSNNYLCTVEKRDGSRDVRILYWDADDQTFYDENRIEMFADYEIELPAGRSGSKVRQHLTHDEYCYPTDYVIFYKKAPTSNLKGLQTAGEKYFYPGSEND